MNEYIFNEDPNQIVKNYFTYNLIDNGVSFPRNIQFEKELILAGKVHLKLLSTLDSKEVGNWLEIYEKKNNYIELPNGNKIVRKPLKNIIINDFFGNYKETINLYPGTVLNFNPHYNKYHIINNSIFSPLIQVYSCLFCNNNEHDALYRLSDKFNISIDISSSVSIPKDNWIKKISMINEKIGIPTNSFLQSVTWSPPQQNNREKESDKKVAEDISTDFLYQNNPLQEQNCWNYLFFGKNNEILMNIRHYYYNGLLLPISLWSSKSSEYLYSLPIAPKQLPLFNFNLIHNDTCNKPVILTEYIELANKNTFNYDGIIKQQNVIWTSWYGGIETINNVDWSLLSGKQVYYYLLHPFNSLTASLQKQLKSKNIELFFIYFNPKWDIASNKSIENWLSIVENGVTPIGISLISENDQFKIEPISNNELEICQASNPLVKDLIDEISSTLIFSDNINSNIWFMISLAYCLSEGINLLKNSKTWQISGTGNKVIYLANKSKSNVYKRVLSKIINIYSDERLSTDNFYMFFMNKTHYFRDFIENKILENYLEKTKIKDSIIVLDDIIDISEIKQQNLISSLTSWIEHLKNHGHTVIINNPSANATQLDQLYKLDLTDSKLRFIANDKQQNQFRILSETYGILLKPIVAKFDLESDTGGWNIIDSKLTGKDNILGIIEKHWAEGKSIDETKSFLEVKNSRTINNYRNKVLDKYFSKGYSNSEIAKAININLLRVEKRRINFDKKTGKSK